MSFWHLREPAGRNCTVARRDAGRHAVRHRAARMDNAFSYEIYARQLTRWGIASIDPSSSVSRAAAAGFTRNQMAYSAGRKIRIRTVPMAVPPIRV
jgi:hypothetical protein